jgi:hypothetical protein
MEREAVTTRKKPTKSAAELRDMIAAARRNIAAVPGALQRTGMELRLQQQEKRLFGSKGK